MKKNGKKFFVWILMLVVLLSGTVAANKTVPLKAEVSTEKCYRIYRKVKIGKYYYRVNRNGKLQRSKSKSKNFKTIVESNLRQYLSTGKFIYYINETTGKEKTTVYRCRMNGKSKKKILTVKKDISLSTIYKNKLYVYQGGEAAGYVTYSISLKGKARLKKVKKQLCLFNERKGQYILGAEWEPTDVSAYGVCIYDAKKNKKISLGPGTAACFIGKKVYYASYDSKEHCYYIKRCNLNGSNKEVLATVDNTIWYVTNVTKTYYEGYSSPNGLTTDKIKY